VIFDHFVVDLPGIKQEHLHEARPHYLSAIVFNVYERVQEFVDWEPHHWQRDWKRGDAIGNLASPLPYNFLALCFENVVFIVHAHNHRNGWPALLVIEEHFSFLKSGRGPGVRDGESILRLKTIDGKYRRWAPTMPYVFRYADDGAFIGSVNGAENRELLMEAMDSDSFDYDRIQIEVADDEDERRSIWYLAARPNRILNRFLEFLTCTNIRVQDVVPTSKEQRERKRCGLRPLVSYKTLELQQRSAGARGEERGSWTNRVHLCRGHFAVYTDAAPLFGKYVGKFWIPPHARGDRAKGMVVKDYAFAEGELVGRDG
jgi:hypothetical protein